jgi:arsenite-transporting ATPase
MLRLLAQPPRYLFFTGKGGVGKTSAACATALHLADAGRRVLVVSTDPASNLDEVLGLPLGDRPRAVAGAAGLEAMNIDREAAAEAYRERVLAQLPLGTAAEQRASVREQLSGACTTEIAAFDEFVGLLAGGSERYDHVVFDTAPTGHTLRLLRLPGAWTGFLAGNDRGASCLGPHSGLKSQEARFRQALRALADPALTRIVLVTRPEHAALDEAARTAEELVALGLRNQHLLINGVFRPEGPTDAVARAWAAQGAAALERLPEALRRLPRDELPLRPFDIVGLAGLRGLLDGQAPAAAEMPRAALPAMPKLAELVDELAAPGHGLIMVMGKGGVGKTTMAAAIAVGLVARGHRVHLSTTDPAAHLAQALAGEVEGLRVDRIDPRAETERYVERVMAAKGRDLDPAGRELLREDLRSPCTEEVAVFHAFSRIVAEARAAFVVLDTAPTGHTLLLLDAAGAYHRQMLRDLASAGGRMVTPLMRLQDPRQTKILLVTLPEITPISEAAALQGDLRRARIEPYAWIVNRSLAATGTNDPVLGARGRQEAVQVARVTNGLAARAFLVPWLPQPPFGARALRALVGRSRADAA